MMTISSRQYAQSLFEVIGDKSKPELEKLVHNLGLILVRQHDLGQAVEIIKDFQEIWDREHGELTVELLSARQLESTGKELIVSYLQKRTGMTKINLREKIQKNLQGGFILRYQSRIVDGSLRSNLEKLKNRITN